MTTFSPEEPIWLRWRDSDTIWRRTNAGYAPMHDARKIANLLLSEFDSKRFDVTNLKLNKILFFLHAFHLVRNSRPLIKNHFEAWEHGPVVRVVYHEFKLFERAPITSLAKHLN